MISLCGFSSWLTQFRKNAEWRKQKVIPSSQRVAEGPEGPTNADCRSLADPNPPARDLRASAGCSFIVNICSTSEPEWEIIFRSGVVFSNYAANQQSPRGQAREL